MRVLHAIRKPERRTPDEASGVTVALAVRNLRRNHRRSLATVTAAAVGGMAILLFGGYKANIKYGMQTEYVSSGGHIQIQHRDFLLYGSGDPAAYGIADYQRLIEAILCDDVLRGMVVVATPALQFSGVAGNYAAGVSRTVIGLGLVAADYHRMRQWNEFGVPTLQKGFALKDTARESAVLGVGLARVLRLCEALHIADCPPPGKTRQRGARDVPAGPPATMPADIAALSLEEAGAQSASIRREPHQVELLVGSPRGSPNVASLSLVAADKQGFKELDEIMLQMHLAQAQQLVYGKEPPEATSIMVQLRHSGHTAAARERLGGLLARVMPGQPLAALDFEARNPFYVQSIRLFDTIFGFMFMLIGGIVLFTVGNTMNTAVVERTVEIGTLRAMGLRRGGILRLFVLEGFLLGCLGAVLGLAAALAASMAVNRAGLTWMPPGAAGEVGLELRVWGELGLMACTALGLVAVAVASAWWPARRAARLDVVEALRHA